jgi:hypothetical protein
MCLEDGRKDAGANPYVVIEEEYRLMGYYKRFESGEEYREYDVGRKTLRDLYMQIRTDEQRDELDRESLNRAKKEWLERACVWNNRWGEMYTPQDIRTAVEQLMEEVEPGTWLWWTPFTVVAATREQLGHIDHFRVED